GNGTAIVNQGSLTIRSSTIAANGFGLDTQGDEGITTAGASLFVENGDGDCTGTIDSLGYNVFEDSCDCAVTAQPGDILDLDLYGAELLPLANNGGPTLTHA